MQCPQCGTKMEAGKECPQCGARVVSHPAHKRYVQPGQRSGLPTAVMVIIGVGLVGFIAVLFFSSDLYKTIRAKRLFENGRYAASVDILFDLMDKSGPDEYTVGLVSDALRAEGEERMDADEYAYAIPLFDKVIDINNESLGAGGDLLTVVRAMHDKAVCYLKLAQEEGKWVEPYGMKIMLAEDTLDEAFEKADELETDQRNEILPDMYFLGAIISTERAVSMLHDGNKSQARVFVKQAEGRLDKAIEMGIDEGEYSLVQNELDELARNLE